MGIRKAIAPGRGYHSRPIKNSSDLKTHVMLFLVNWRQISKPTPLASHLEIGGWGNTGNVTRIAGHSFLSEHKGDTWMALAADIPILRTSCGYVGTSDGWQEIARAFKVEHEFAAADDGNIALSAELDLRHRDRFTLGLPFGNSLHWAVTTLFQSLGIPFGEHSVRMREQRERAAAGLRPLTRTS